MRKQQIDTQLEELRQAMYENFDASTAEDNAKTRKIKAHYRLRLAQEALRALNYEDVNEEKYYEQKQKEYIEARNRDDEHLTDLQSSQ